MSILKGNGNMLTVVIICVTLYLSVVTVCKTAIHIAGISHKQDVLNSTAIAEMEKALNDAYTKPDSEAPVNFDEVIKAISEVWDDEN